MRPLPVTHTLERHLAEVRVRASSESLALVDVESYPVFIGKAADYFDMMAHLSAQMQALTAIAWKAPDRALNLRFCLTGDDQVLEQTKANRVIIASGNVRCYGQLCLAAHERLFDCARHRTHSLVRGGRSSAAATSLLLNLPPGIYSVFIYYHADSSYAGSIDTAGAAAKAGYTVLLRHYPFPPPRVAPVRVSSGFFKNATPPAGENIITSHRRIW